MSDTEKAKAPRRKSGIKVSGYQKIADQLRKEIVRDFKPGDRLESEGGMAKRFGVSNLTIRQALTVLEQEGHIVRRQGSGSYVQKHSEIVKHVAIFCELDIFGPDASFYYRYIADRIRYHLKQHNIPCRLYIGNAVPGVPFVQEMKCQEFRDDLALDRISGVVGLAISSESTEWVADAKERKIPMVGTIGSDEQDVLTDLDRFIDDLAAFMNDRGKTRLGYIGYGFFKDDTAEKLEAKGIELFKQHQFHQIIPNTVGMGRRAFSDMWATDPKPEVLFVGDDNLWPEVMTAMLQSGVDVPGDLDVICANHVGQRLIIPFPMTLVELDIDEAAKCSAGFMIKRLSGKNIKKGKQYLPLVWREVDAP